MGGGTSAVTSLNDRLHPVGPTSSPAGCCTRSPTPRGVPLVVEFVATAPDELAVTASTDRAPPAMPIRRMFSREVGHHARGVLRQRPVRRRTCAAAATPVRPAVGGLIAPMPYVRCRPAPTWPTRRAGGNYWKSHYLDAMTYGAIANAHRARSADDVPVVVVLLPAPGRSDHPPGDRHRRVRSSRRGVRPRDADRLAGRGRGRRPSHVRASSPAGWSRKRPASTSTTRASKEPPGARPHTPQRSTTDRPVATQGRVRPDQGLPPEPEHPAQPSLTWPVPPDKTQSVPLAVVMP